MNAGKIRLLDETVEYFDYGEFVRAVIYRTDPETGQKTAVDEFALTLHSIQSSLYGPNGKIAACERLRARMAKRGDNVIDMKSMG